MIRTHLPPLLAGLLFVSLLPGCSDNGPGATATPAPTPAPAPASTPASTPAPDPVAQAAAQPDTWHFRIGELDAYALRDGDLDIPNDGKTFGVGQSVEDMSALLTGAGLPTDKLQLSMQGLLVRRGERVLLFDAGAAQTDWAHGGRLPASMRAAGVEPAQVTDIFISHRHRDHIAGLLTPEGALAFPNATIRMTVSEWDALETDGEEQAMRAAIKPKVKTFELAARLVPGVVTALPWSGHTQGHSAYEITSGGERLLYVGDTVHHVVVSVQRPDWSLQYDDEAKRGAERRRELLQRAADENLRVFAFHFPFPGVGHVKAREGSFVWVAEPR